MSLPITSVVQVEKLVRHVCLSVFLDNNVWTIIIFDLDVWHAVSSWPYLGQSSWPREENVASREFRKNAVVATEVGVWSF